MEKIINIYPKFISNILKENTNIIISPRKISKFEELKVYHKYINGEFNTPFKVENIFDIDQETNYIIRIISTNRYASISSPIHNNTYEIIIEKDEEFFNKDIINDEKIYHGYRIRSWFFRKIKEEYDKYKAFISYIEYNSFNSLNDNKMYKISALYDEETKAYYKIKISFYKR